jgi:hypothetical protein
VLVAEGQETRKTRKANAATQIDQMESDGLLPVSRRLLQLSTAACLLHTTRSIRLVQLI